MMTTQGYFSMNYRITYEDGKVFSTLTCRYLSFQKRGGYLYISLIRVNSGKRKRTTYGQHQLIARAFIPNPGKLEEINHKDGDGLNNSIENLEWITHRGGT